jgi:hypothetical protein
MFAKTGVKLPSGMGTKSPDDVAVAVVRAIRRDLGEVMVAAVDQRLGAFAAMLAPNLISKLQRTFGGDAIANAIVRTQRNVR